ncbi:MAG: DUF4097 family beta strand repeat-containing protein [Hespellia sp.]|nr:DUF4097 family beta strand repeat-containing protein [Hespellia sp.]
MKKGWKIFWIVCAVIAMIGLGFCTAGLVMGVTLANVRDAFGDSISMKSSTDYRYNSDGDEDASKEIAREEVKTSDLRDTETYEGVKELDVDFGAGSLVIKPYSGSAIRVDSSGVAGSTDYSVDQSDGELNIDAERGTWHAHDLGQLIIYVPQDQVFDEMSISIGAGEVTIGDVLARDMSIECGAGQVVYVTSEAEDNFNYSIECGIGQVKIGDNSYSGIVSDRTIDNNTTNNIDIECGAGEVSISFE